MKNEINDSSQFQSEAEFLKRAGKNYEHDKAVLAREPGIFLDAARGNGRLPGSNTEIPLFKIVDYLARDFMEKIERVVL